jgi:hypothetical protein
MINWIRHAALLGFVVIFMTAVAASAQTQPASDYRQELLHQLGGRNVRVHDPSAIIKCKDEYWIFYTGVGTPSIHSTDLVNWSAGPHTFAAPPAWVKQAVPANRGDLWAPDVIQIGNRTCYLFPPPALAKTLPRSASRQIQRLIPPIRPITGVMAASLSDRAKTMITIASTLARFETLTAGYGFRSAAFGAASS